MNWLHRYQVRYYLRNSLWIWPALSILAAMVATRLLLAIDAKLNWELSDYTGSVQVLLSTLASAMFTFIVFVSSALLVAVQLASSQLTPRIIAIVFSDSRTRFALIVFVFTFMLTLSTLVHVGSTVPRLTATVAAYCCVASLAVFLFLIDHVGRFLRPSGALWSVASLGREVIENVYPNRLADRSSASASNITLLDEEPTRTIPSRKDGVILAIDIAGLLALAGRFDCVIELVPQVGDFVVVGDPMFRIFKAGENLPATALLASVAVGQERTLEQDPTFAFRILVDIASKGLSPAINDPTTAVLAIDQIHHLLRNVGGRLLEDERVHDTAGQVRVLYRTPDWDDFVRLAVTEIRQFGGTSIQIARRLRAMLENLMQTLSEERAALLQQELSLLNRSAARFFNEPEDLALAEISDLQGVGGKHGRSQTDRRSLQSKGR